MGIYCVIPMCSMEVSIGFGYNWGLFKSLTVGPSLKIQRQTSGLVLTGVIFLISWHGGWASCFHILGIRVWGPFSLLKGFHAPPRLLWVPLEDLA
jgi:hypothetical protein